MISLVSPTLGAVNDGVAVAGPVSVTAGPLVCAHEYDREVSSGSPSEAVPLSVTVAPSVTVWLAPALAVGGELVLSRMVTSTVSVDEAVSSETVSVNRTGVSAATLGAANEVSRAAASARVMPSAVLLKVQA